MFPGLVSKYIEENNLLDKDGLHLVALSGGADSVALLRVLLRLGYHVEAMHCNFNLRGDESRRDEEFCKSLCAGLGVPLHLAHFDTKTYSTLHHISIEMAARNLRYSYFQQLLQELEAGSICVAHHKDDCAETVLMNIVRGTGITGLSGIRPKNGNIIRPLLCVCRRDIEQYLASLQQPYITDSSNLVADVKRNRIRLDIMPLLQEMNPSVTDSIAAMARHIADALPMLNDAVDRWEQTCTATAVADAEPSAVAISIRDLMATPSPEFMLYAMLSRRGIPSQLSRQIFDALSTSQTGASWQVQDKMLTIDRGCLLIETLQPAFHEMKLPMPGRYNLSNGNSIELAMVEKDAAFRIDTSPYVAQLDADCVSWPLTIREVANGDRFVPFGMTGSKLVSDVLTDRKMPLQRKRRQLCVTDASGEIVWLVGLRISNKCRISSHTIKYVYLRYIKVKCN